MDPKLKIRERLALLPAAADRKRSLRRRIKLRMASLAPEYNESSDREIVKRVLELPEYRSAGCVFCFVGVGGEVDTMPIIQRALLDGKRLVVPLCTGKGIMEAREIRSVNELSPGRYGIPEPAPSCPPVEAWEIELAVVPCVTCDRGCRRLGHGGGYYDRYLSGRRFPAAALCRKKLMSRRVPLEAHDLTLDMVITEKETIRRRDRAGRAAG